jgi:hypothetical protein
LIHEAQILVTGRIQFDYQKTQYENFLMTKSTEPTGSFYQPFVGSQIDGSRTLQKCCCDSLETLNKLKKPKDLAELVNQKFILIDKRKGFCAELSAAMYRVIGRRSVNFPDRLYGPIQKVHNTDIFELKVELKRKKCGSIPGAELSFSATDALSTFDNRFDTITEDMFNAPYYVPSAIGFDHEPIVKGFIENLVNLENAAVKTAEDQQAAVKAKSDKTKEKKRNAALLKKEREKTALQYSSVEVDSVFHEMPTPFPSDLTPPVHKRKADELSDNE